MSYRFVSFETEPPLAIVTMNRPDVFNAIDGAMLAEMRDAVQKCEKDGAIRAVILTGSGEKAFCSGGDVKAMRAGLSSDTNTFLADTLPELHALVAGIRGLSKPVVAAINGVAAGAGVNIALACDLRVAAERARLIEAYINVGLSCDGGGSYLLPRLVGLARASELLLLGEAVDAHQAERLGLVNRVVPDAELMSTARELASQLAAKPTFAVGRIKALLNLSFDQDLPSQLEAERQNILACARTADFREAVTAFAEKRPPKFKGV